MTGTVPANGLFDVNSLAVEFGYTPGMYLDQVSAAIKGAKYAKEAVKTGLPMMAAPAPAPMPLAAPRPVVVLPQGQGAAATSGAVATAGGAGGAVSPYGAAAPAYNAAAPGAINVVTST